MYRGASPLFKAGHESAGLTELATEWFLAEGNAGDFFDEFVLIGNTTGNAALVQADFIVGNTGTIYTKQYQVNRQLALQHLGGRRRGDARQQAVQDRQHRRVGAHPLAQRRAAHRRACDVVARQLQHLVRGAQLAGIDAHGEPLGASPRVSTAAASAGTRTSSWPTPARRPGTLRIRLLLPNGQTGACSPACRWRRSRARRTSWPSLLEAAGLPTDTQAGVLIESEGTHAAAGRGARHVPQRERHHVPGGHQRARHAASVTEQGATFHEGGTLPTRAAAAPAWRYVVGGMVAAACAAAANLAWRSAYPGLTGYTVPRADRSGVGRARDGAVGVAGGRCVPAAVARLRHRHAAVRDRLPGHRGDHLHGAVHAGAARWHARARRLPAPDDPDAPDGRRHGRGRRADRRAVRRPPATSDVPRGSVPVRLWTRTRFADSRCPDPRHPFSTPRTSAAVPRCRSCRVRREHQQHARLHRRQIAARPSAPGRSPPRAGSARPPATRPLPARVVATTGTPFSRAYAMP